jgi:30S ribosomal protein S31
MLIPEEILFSFPIIIKDYYFCPSVIKCISNKIIDTMGKGDKKTRRGKLFAGSFGITRPKKRKNKYVKAEEENKSAEKETNQEEVTNA